MLDVKKYRDLMSSVELAKSQEQVKALFQEFCNASDFEYYLFASICSVNSLSSPQVLTISNYPDEWIKTYFSEKLQKHDPVVKYCFENTSPIRWDKLIKMDKYTDHYGEGVMQRAASLGLVNGLSIPVNTRSGEIAIFSLASKRDENIDERMMKVLSYAQVFGALAMDTFQRLRRDEPGRKKEKLTPREIECLFWACEGKTTWEISKIVDVSERTIIFHLTSATKKLGAVNRQHAVAKAIISGLVRPMP
ncbi:LuxR family transcriptional regulator [Teredinibacter sp. KSP-S5-2]|uniref:helix-turn-helix transcriptional regulator n=1 Tax=Teredinibacter sp. KSP-S5-2 TaxID=3034506 RepID=UPI002934A7A6|nr:LuxR family transcriptional regulator [Teredinibacter sp. KSP-S5-2]WNO10688.1 LuxR family transcriptional regulator [Teredinibacter sp. KSP-S5-2]